MMNIIPINSRAASPGAPRPAGSRSTRVIAITSGKGGVGKTNITSNLAIALAQQGSKVCIFDADANLANINVIMGLSPRYTIEHLLSGERQVDEVMMEGPEGVMVIPAASGIAECLELDRRQRQRLIAALERLEASFDYILIDTAAGIGESVLSFIQSAQYTILVISTEPTSLTDAFALLRMLKRRDYEHPVYVLVNMAQNYANSMEIFKRFEAAVNKHLILKVQYLGYVTDDQAIRISVGQQRPVVLNRPEALASRCFTTLASVLNRQFTHATAAHRFSSYWNDAARGTLPRQGTAPAGGSQGSTEDAPRDPAAELQTMASRADALLTDPSIDAAQGARFLGPLLEIYFSRFLKLPIDLDDLSRLFIQSGYSQSELCAHLETLAGSLDRPVMAPGKAPSPEDPPSGRQERHDEILREYRAIAERLALEETQLHQALEELCKHVTRLSKGG